MTATTTTPRDRFMTTFTDEDQAYAFMRAKNRTYERRGDRINTACLVDGPQDGQWTVCDIEAAIDLGIRYRWEV